MKKSLKIITVLAVILALLIPYTISYGADDETLFFEVLSEEITISDNIEATLNIEEVDYNNFIFELVADFDISEIEIVQDEETDEEDVDENENTEIVIENNNDITICINKSVTSLTQITLTCAVPSDINVGDTILLTATVTNSDNEEESETISVTITVVETTTDISAESVDSDSSESNLTEVGTSGAELSSDDVEEEMLSSSEFDNLETNISGINRRKPR